MAGGLLAAGQEPQGSSVEVLIPESRPWLSMSLLSRVPVGGEKLSDPKGSRRDLGTRSGNNMSGNPLALICKRNCRSNPIASPLVPLLWS